jgi:hypothetical protein
MGIMTSLASLITLQELMVGMVLPLCVETRDGLGAAHTELLLVRTDSELVGTSIEIVQALCLAASSNLCKA